MSQKRKHGRKIRFTVDHLNRKAQRLTKKLDSTAFESDKWNELDFLYTAISNEWSVAKDRWVRWLDKHDPPSYWDRWSPMDDGRTYAHYEACMSVGDYEGANNCWS